MSVTERLERAVRDCDFRLTFLQHGDIRSKELRRELEERRADAVEHLAQIRSGRVTRLPQA
jgi:hypothetical protein